MHLLPGAHLLHPLALLSSVGLLLNDHVLKRASPGLISGKLSDVFGLVLFPLWLQAAFELLDTRRAQAKGLTSCGAGYRARFEARSNRALLGAAMACALAFSAVELWWPAELCYRHGLGLLQWPFRALIAFAQGEKAWPGYAAVSATADVTDLLALPALGLAVHIGLYRPTRAPAEAAPHRRSSWLRAQLIVLMIPATLATLGQGVRSAAAAPLVTRPSDRRHDGLFVEGGLGGGVVHAASNSSLSNGFAQRLRSSTWSPALPVFTLSIGGTPAPGLVIAFEYERSLASPLVIRTRTDTFKMSDLGLSVEQFGALFRYYPNPEDGLYFGAKLAYGVLQVLDRTSGFDGTSLRSGKELTGIVAAPEAGYGIWLSRGYSLSAAFRPELGYFKGGGASANYFALGVFTRLTWH